MLSMVTAKTIATKSKTMNVALLSKFAETLTAITTPIKITDIFKNTFIMLFNITLKILILSIDQPTVIIQDCHGCFR